MYTLFGVSFIVSVLRILFESLFNFISYAVLSVEVTLILWVRVDVQKDIHGMKVIYF